MIKDNLKHANKYYCLNGRIKKGLEYLENTDFTDIPNGKYLIDGENIYASIQDYMTKAENEAKFEAHRRYIDIQYIIDGEEKMGACDINQLEENYPYNEEKDIIFFDSPENLKADYVIVKKNEFIIFEPTDAHKPSLMVDTASYVKKIVVKVLI